jgi:hypothetical protein
MLEDCGIKAECVQCRVGRYEAMKRPYYSPRNLPPSTRLLLATHQTGRDVGDLVEPFHAGRLVIDESDQAIAACRRALIVADDRRRGVIRQWVDDLKNVDGC